MKRNPKKIIENISNRQKNLFNCKQFIQLGRVKTYVTFSCISTSSPLFFLFLNGWQWGLISSKSFFLGNPFSSGILLLSLRRKSVITLSPYLELAMRGIINPLIKEVTYQNRAIIAILWHRINRISSRSKRF